MTGPDSASSHAHRELVAWAPGRVNLIGEHTDYNGGLVLPIAIDRGVTARLHAADDEAGLVITSRQVPGEQVRIAWSDLAPGCVSGWAAYVAGAVWSQLTLSGPVSDKRGLPGLAIEIDGDVPLGAGLSSSAAVECAVVTALSAWWGMHHRARDLARIAQRAENEFVGVPTGSMDQVASMMATEGHAVFFDVAEDVARQVPVGFDERGLALLVIDTRAAHSLVDGGYAARRASCEQAAALLGVPTLRRAPGREEAVAELVAAGADNEVVKRARHVIGEITRVGEAVEALERADLVGFGALMDASHASLRDDFEVSCAELDVAVDAARAAGAIGARMTGGGFGGSAIALTPVDRVGDVTAAVADAFAAAGFAEPRIWEVHAVAGARVIPPPM